MLAENAPAVRDGCRGRKIQSYQIHGGFQMAKLNVVVGQLIAQSERNGKEAEARLERGLTIGVTVGKKNTRLRLKRSGVYPSDAEWKTVVRAWPYPVTTDLTEQLLDGSLHMLVGAWPTPAKLPGISSPAVASVPDA
jgi:hypothetical protein